jgi:hypothetical protein
MPVYTLTAEFTDDDRKAFAAVLRDISIGYPDYHHTLRSKDKDHREAIPAEVRALKAAALNKEPFTYERVLLAEQATQQQYECCVEQSDIHYWKAQETPGVDPKVSAQYGEARMGEVLAEARAEQAGRAEAALTILSRCRNTLDHAEANLP